MGLTRKKYIIDKKFQFSISFKAVILPLVTILSISAVLLYFSINNNKLISNNNSNISTIVENQGKMINMFLSTPALQQSGNRVVEDGVKTFKNNIGRLKKISSNSFIITKNSTIVFYFLIIMTVVQTVIIFSLFVFFSHKISGPIKVMSNQMRDIRENRKPNFRPLRRRDELVVFYKEFQETIEFLKNYENLSKKDRNDDNGRADS